MQIKGTPDSIVVESPPHSMIAFGKYMSSTSYWMLVIKQLGTFAIKMSIDDVLLNIKLLFSNSV